MRRGAGISLFALAYVGLGVATAASHHSFQHVHGWRGVLSVIFGVSLWPLILLGVNLHVKKKLRFAAVMAGDRVKLQVSERDRRGARVARGLREAGFIPGVLYGKGK